MADSKYSHLIDIIFAAKDAGKTKTDIQSVFDTIGTGGKITPRSTVAVNDFQKALRRAAIVAPVWLALRGVMMSVLGLIRSQIQFVVELEDAMARIQIVGKGTAEEYNNLKYSLVGLSLAYGVASADALNAAKIFAQQGKTVSETLVLTRVAMLGAQVLGQSVEQTTEDLTAAMNAFNIPAEKSVAIIDSLINVEKQFAVTSKDLAAGIKVTGATANQMGVSLAALSGDIAAVIEVTRKSGAEAARGLSFIYARLLTSAKPVIEQLTGIKFYLDENNRATSAITGTLRSATDILDELATKWDNLSNEQQLNIAISLGSKRQLVTLNALMQNYTTAIDARVAALTSAGKAEQALIILQDTTSYKLKQLTSSLNALTSAIADTRAFKSLVDNINYALLVYTKLLNAEKGARIELAASNEVILADIDARKSQISSLEEIIKLRDKLAAAPPTDKNLERIQTLNTAITEISKKYPKIKIAIESAKPEEIKRAVGDINNQLLSEDIIARVQIEYQPRISALRAQEKQIRSLIKGLSPAEIELLRPGATAELINIEKQRAELYKQQRQEVEKQYTLAKAQRMAADISDDEERAQLSGRLTDKEKEQLDIANQLIQIKSMQSDNIEAQVLKEIELVSAAKYVYDASEKTLKLEQLRNELLDARLQKQVKEREQVNALLFDYAQANRLEKERIRRQIELQTYTPEAVAAAYSSSERDRQIILQSINTFSKVTQDLVAGIIAAEAGITRPTIVAPEIPPAKAIPQISPTVTQNVIGAQTVNVTVNTPAINPEDIADDVADNVKDALLADANWLKRAGNKISFEV